MDVATTAAARLAQVADRVCVLLGQHHFSAVTELAKTVHSLGKGNLPDLLAMTLPSDLMKGILLQMSDPEFRGLDDSVFMRRSHPTTQMLEQ
jgi:hypothetical protein